MKNILFWENKEPDFINELGVKWWIDHDTMKFTKLNNKYQIFVINNNDMITRVITDNEKQTIVYESQQLEAIGAFCDILNFMETDKYKNT